MIKYALSSAMISGATLGVIAMACIHTMILKKYRKRIFRLRQGKYFFDKSQYTLYSAYYFIGLQAVHSVLGFLLWVLFIGLFVFCMAHTTIRTRITNALITWLQVAAVITLIAQTVSKVVARFLLVSHGSIDHLRMFTIYDIAFSFLGVISALLMSMLRMFVFLFISLIQVARLDLKPMHQQLLASLDYGYHSYIDAMLIDHNHNNPVLLVFCGLLTDGMKSRRSEQRDRRRQTMAQATAPSHWSISTWDKFNAYRIKFLTFLDKNRQFNGWQFLHHHHRSSHYSVRHSIRWWLYIILHKNPHLRTHRKHAIQQRWEELMSRISKTEKKGECDDDEMIQKSGTPLHTQPSSPRSSISSTRRPIQMMHTSSSTSTLPPLSPIPRAITSPSSTHRSLATSPISIHRTMSPTSPTFPSSSPSTIHRTMPTSTSSFIYPSPPAPTSTPYERKEWDEMLILNPALHDNKSVPIPQPQPSPRQRIELPPVPLPPRFANEVEIITSTPRSATPRPSPPLPSVPAPSPSPRSFQRTLIPAPSPSPRSSPRTILQTIATPPHIASSLPSHDHMSQHQLIAQQQHQQMHQEALKELTQ